MGFFTNALYYGWTTSSIITKAERDANRICKGIKNTVIKAPNETDELEEDENEVSGCKIIFHPELCYTSADSKSEDTCVNVTNYLDEQSKESSGQENTDAQIK